MTKAKQGLEKPEQNNPQQNQQGNQPQQGMTQRESYAPSTWSGSPWGTSFSPFSIMSRFADEMDRMFENSGFGRGLSPGLGRGWGDMEESDLASLATWSPQIEAFEHDGQFVVRADLPGMTKDNVKVEVTDQGLTLQGERKQEHEDKKEGWHRRERSYGSFFRRIPLPEGVKADEAKANFRDGVLEITMPSTPRQENRRSIEIK